MPTAYLSPSLLQDLTNVSVSPGAGNTGYPLVWNNTSGRFELAVLGVSGGGTGTSNGSITGTGALTFAATGANNNVTLTPGAGGYGNIAGVTIRAGAGASSQALGSTANSSAGDWIAQGRDAGVNNTVGGNWIAQGREAGVFARTNSNWMAQGLLAGRANEEGVQWIAQSTFAAYSNTVGSFWIAQGASAGVFNTVGSDWIAQGSGAGVNNVIGSNWMAQGRNAGVNNVTGSSWIAQGFEAGYFEERGSTWHVGVDRSKSLVVGRFDTNCIYFGHAGPITNAATCPNPTAAVHCAASTTARASLRLDTGVAPTSPNNGDIWFDGTDIKMRIGGVTRTFQLV